MSSEPKWINRTNAITLTFLIGQKSLRARARIRRKYEDVYWLTVTLNNDIMPVPKLPEMMPNSNIFLQWYEISQYSVNERETYEWYLKLLYSICCDTTLESVCGLTDVSDLVSHHVLVVVDSGKRNLLLLGTGRNHKQPLHEQNKRRWSFHVYFKISPSARSRFSSGSPPDHY